MIKEVDSSPVQATLATGTPAIEVKDLRKTYSEGLIRRKKFEALKGITLSVNEGEIFGLLGPNGAGKTTLVKILLGIIRKTDGHAAMLGLPAGSQEGRNQVGYLPEHLRVPPHLTGFQALEYYGNLSNVPTSLVRKKRGELLELVGLAGRAKDATKKYSKGMLQRLGLAQALLHDPKLVVMDEPTDGLDPRARAEMREIIRSLQGRGVTVFLNSHLLQEVEMVCQRVAILDKGNLRYCGEVSEIGAFVNNQARGELAGVTAEGAAAVDAAGQEQAIEFSLKGNPQDVEACFEGVQHEMVASTADQISVAVNISDQAKIDEMVDRLREKKISLISLVRKRVTLEDAFLQIIDEKSSKN